MAAATTTLFCLPTPTSDPRIVIAGGGSGGHIFPALSVAASIRSLSPSTRITFLGSPSPSMESALVSAAGFDFCPLPGPRKLFRPLVNPLNLLLPFRLLRSLLFSLSLLRTLSPAAVVGTGAHVSAAACLAAAISGVPLVVQEQNAYPGITNRMLAPYAERVFLAFSTCLKYFPREKCEVVGNPLKIGFGRGHGKSKAEARRVFFDGVGDEAQVVLVLGGSTGAKALNMEFIKVCWAVLEEDGERHIIWQTGAEWYDEVRRTVRSHRRLLMTP